MREEVHQYFRHMCLKLDLNRDIIYNTLVTGVKWNHDHLPFNRRWDVYADEKGTTKLLAKSQFFIPCTGYTTQPYVPPIPGISKFPQAYHTARWPANVDLKDKRVAVLGTGASSVQVIESISPIVKHLTVLQRTPNLTNPRQQDTLSPMAADEHPEMERRFDKMKGTRTGLEVEYVDRNTFDDTPEDRIAFYESLWRRGGQAFWFGNYKDLLVDPEANREAYSFWLSKVRSRIHDPAKRDILAPETPPHAFGCKRPALEEQYYEAFNQPNVDLIDVKNSDEIIEITDKGMLLKSGKFVELDVLVFATGYDAAIGSLMKMDIRGKDGVSLRDKWGQSEWYNAENSPTFGDDVKRKHHSAEPPTTTAKKELRSPFEVQPTAAGPSNPQEQEAEQDPYTTGVQTYLGLFTSGFPNLIFPAGPHAPTAFGITPRLAELQGRWVVDVIYHVLRTKRKGSIEATEDAEMGWKVGVEEAVDQLLVKDTKGWYMGNNIPGRKKEPLFWFGGVPEYMECLEAEEEGGYENFLIE